MLAAASWRTVSAAPPDAAGEPAGLPEGAALGAAARRRPAVGAALAAGEEADGERVLPARWNRGRARREDVVRVAPAGHGDGLAGGRVDALELQRGRGRDERDQLLEVPVVQRPGRVALVRPDRHQRVRVTAHVAAADRQDALQVARREVGEQLGLVVEGRPDPALALGAVAARTVRLEQRVALRHVGDLLGGDLVGQDGWSSRRRGHRGRRSSRRSRTGRRW